MSIQRFLSTHICLYRPIKQTYHILEWCSEKQHWFPYSGPIHPSDLRICKSLEHSHTTITIKLRSRTISLACDGHYLQVSDYDGKTVSSCIPICTRSEESIPQSLLQYSTPPPTISTMDFTEMRLWKNE